MDSVFNKYPYIFITIASFFLLLSLPPFSLIPFYFISYSVIIYLYIENDNFDDKKLFLYFFINYLVSLHWILQSFMTGGASYIVLGSVMVLILVLILSLLNTIIIALLNYLINKKIIKIFLFPLSLTLISLIKEYVLGGFPWNPSAIIWVENLWVLKVLPLIGVYGLGIINHLIVSLIIYLIYLRQKLNLYLVITVILVLYLSKFIILTNNNNDLKSEESLSIVLIQPNIKETLTQNKISANLTTYENLTSEAIEQFPLVDVIIWPEGSLPIDLNNRPNLIKRISHLINKNQLIIIGSQALENNNLYNRLYVIDHNGKINQYYDKQKLVLLGEYVPFGQTFISKFLDSGMNFSKGAESRKLKLQKNFVASPMICFESIFDSSIIHKDICASDFILQVSNDSWFGSYYGPLQHLKNSIIRSVEKNLTLIRSTPSGISAIVKHDGQVEKSLMSNKKGYLQYNINKRISKNCNSMFGFTIIFIILIYCFGIIYDRLRR